MNATKAIPRYGAAAGRAAATFSTAIAGRPAVGIDINPLGYVKEGSREKAKFLITSPPYHNVSNYYYDQRLRIWLLGGPAHPTTCASNQYGGKFSNQLQYRQLFVQVFAKCKLVLTDDAVIYVRTDERESTYRNTKSALEFNFPEKRITEELRPMPLQNQTKAYSRGGSPKKAHNEVDLVLEPR